jgi:hypothetical protein
MSDKQGRAGGPSFVVPGEYLNKSGNKKGDSSGSLTTAQKSHEQTNAQIEGALREFPELPKNSDYGFTGDENFDLEVPSPMPSTEVDNENKRLADAERDRFAVTGEFNMYGLNPHVATEESVWNEDVALMKFPDLGYIRCNYPGLCRYNLRNPEHKYATEKEDLMIHHWIETHKVSLIGRERPRLICELCGPRGGSFRLQWGLDQHCKTEEHVTNQTLHQAMQAQAGK